MTDCAVDSLRFMHSLMRGRLNNYLRNLLATMVRHELSPRRSRAHLIRSTSGLPFLRSRDRLGEKVAIELNRFAVVKVGRSIR
jgi:hypothetical protein